MKFNNIKKLLLVATTVAITGIGCKKQEFLNTNGDSITSETVDFRTVLPASMTATATIIEGTTFKYLQNWMGYWARSGSFQDVTDEESYNFTNDFNAGVWNGLYGNANNYNFVVTKANAVGAGFYEAIGRIMKSHNMQILVDIYGNVPYSQAFLGLEVRTPAYDKGRDVYDSLFVDLDRAIALLKDPIASSIDNNRNIDVNDLIFGGDATSWIKFANTLKLRMIIHAYQVPGFDIAGKIAAIEAEGTGYLGAGENVHLNPGYVDTKPTPFYRANVKTETGTVAAQGNIERANAYAVGPNPGGPGVGYYGWDGDPRLDKFYTPPSSGVHRGIPYGEIAGTNSNNTGDKLSTVDGEGYIPDGAASRAWIFTAAESLFLQAEARERGIITTGATAEVLLNTAVDESFIWLGLTATDAQDYRDLNATYPDVDYNGVSQGPGLPAGGLFTILSQKWFALNGIAVFEVYTDWRRTDVVYGEGGGFLPGPPLSVNPAAPVNAEIPIRLFYPQNEYNYNAANVLSQGTIDVTSGATEATGRIFWDIN